MTENDSRKKEKNEKPHSTAFYMEALALVAAFTVVILVLTKVFVQSGQMSGKARHLTCAVHLAENAAEAVSASDSPEALCGLLDEGGNAQFIQGYISREFYLEHGMVSAWYDNEMNPAPEGEFRVDIIWLSEETDGDDTGLVRCIIAVYWEDRQVYTLETAVYRRQKP